MFSVSLFRSPKSKVFVLQSTMRCLRSITEIQQTARAYLSKDNYNILDEELEKNFNININTVTTAGGVPKKEYHIKIVEPVINISLSEIKKNYTIKKSSNDLEKFNLSLDKMDISKYISTKTIKDSFDERRIARVERFVSEGNIKYSKYKIIYEVARYLNEYGNVLDIEELLENSGQFDEIEELISNYNDILYDVLIPAIFNYLYKIEEKVKTVKKEVPLIKYPSGYDYFVFRSADNLTIQKDENIIKKYSAKSFHTDRYCFDSEPEEQLFMDLTADPNVEKIYFTGMFTDKEVKAKAVAMAEATHYSDKMEYKLVKSSEIMHKNYRECDKKTR